MAELSTTSPAPTAPPEDLKVAKNDQSDVAVNDDTPGGHSEGARATEAVESNGVVNLGPPAATETQGEDTEMKDSADGGEPTGAPAAAQTPVSTKKGSNGSTKKKPAVPEHKSKKLNKKASKRLTHLDAQPGQYYLARMKGHPPWPSVICDEEMLPMSLLDTRPITTKLPDGSYKKPEYEDGGKRAHDRTFPIMFLHTNEFAWIPNTDLAPLDTSAIDPDDTKGKSKPLAAAYAKAAEHHDLQHFKDMLADHQKAVKEEQEAQTEREAKKASKAKRKSLDAAAAAAAADDEDEMDVDDEVEDPKPKSKKRKKEVDSDGEEKPAKTPKIGTKLKLSTPKTPAETSAKKKASKPKPSTKRAAKSKSSDEDVVETPKVEEKPVSAAEARLMKEKKVLYYRHKLQRGFLSRDTTPKEDEMKSMSEYLTELEGYPDVEAGIIKTTKINKVLKAMIKLPTIPLDEEYKFKDRSMKLLGIWQETLSKEPGAGASGDKDEDGKPGAAAPTTNGLVKPTEEEEESGKAEAEDAAAPEEEAEEAVEKKIGTTTEGEKEINGEEESSPAKETEKVDDIKADEPDIEHEPAKEYQPPAVETAT